MERTYRGRLSEADLSAWGGRIGLEAEPPLFLALRGPLGAGKSVLARAVARGAGVGGAVPSPTFNLLFRYPAARGREVVHLDLYRLSRPEEVIELGWESLGAAGEIVLVEWPERAESWLPPNRWEVALERVEGSPLLRDVSVERIGNASVIPPPAPVSTPARTGGQ